MVAKEALKVTKIEEERELNSAKVKERVRLEKEKVRERDNDRESSCALLPATAPSWQRQRLLGGFHEPYFLDSP